MLIVDLLEDISNLLEEITSFIIFLAFVIFKHETTPRNDFFQPLSCQLRLNELALAVEMGNAILKTNICLKKA